MSGGDDVRREVINVDVNSGPPLVLPPQHV